MTRAIRLHSTGGPEVLRLEEVAVKPPDAEEVQVRQTAIGVNFIDVYDRTGLYPQPLPERTGARGRGHRRRRGQKVRGFRSAIGSRTCCRNPARTARFAMFLRSGWSRCLAAYRISRLRP